MTVAALSAACGASCDLKVHLCIGDRKSRGEAPLEAFKSNRPDVHREAWMDLKTLALGAHEIKLNTNGGS